MVFLGIPSGNAYFQCIMPINNMSHLLTDIIYNKFVYTKVLEFYQTFLSLSPYFNVVQMLSNSMF